MAMPVEITDATFEDAIGGPTAAGAPVARAPGSAPRERLIAALGPYLPAAVTP